MVAIRLLSVPDCALLPVDVLRRLTHEEGRCVIVVTHDPEVAEAADLVLLLGGVLPGLIVLHGSKEISILRALGVRARDCVILYTLSQVLCALAGLVLGIAAVLVALRPELGEVIVPFAIYLAAHLAACALGSGVFAWLCARKRVLEQFQAKE